MSLKNRHRSLCFSLMMALLLLGGCGVATEQSSSQLLAPVSLPPASVRSTTMDQAGAEEIDHRCAYFYFLWGRNAELDNRYNEALEAYEKALICDPQAARVSHKIPLILLRLGRLEEAATWLEQLLSNQPKLVESRLLLAKIYLELKREQDAITQYRHIHTVDPKEIASRLLLSQLYLEKDAFAKAEETVAAIFSQHPNAYLAHIQLARIKRQQKDYIAAETAFESALTVQWSALILREMSEMYKQQGQYDQAEAVLKRLLAKVPKDRPGRLALVQLYLEQGRQADVLRELKAVRAFSPHPRVVDLALARIFLRFKAYDEAIALLKDILQREDDPEVRYLLAVAYYQAAQFNNALQALEFFGPESERYSEALVLQVQLLGQQKKQAAAITLLENAVAIEQGRTGQLFGVLAALYAEGDQQIEIARATYKKGLVLYPQDGDLLYEYGLFLDHIHELTAALQVMEKVIGLMPNNATALNYVGYSWVDTGTRLEEALAHLKKARQIEPDNGYIQDSLGWAYYRLQQPEKALPLLQEALTRVPGDPTIQEHLGDVLQALNRLEEALAAYTSSLVVQKEAPDKVRLQQKIDRLKVKLP